jgi:hypothetical protein
VNGDLAVLIGEVSPSMTVAVTMTASRQRSIAARTIAGVAFTGDDAETTGSP